MAPRPRLSIKLPPSVRLPGIPRAPRGFGRFREMALLPRGERAAERFTVSEPAGDPPDWWRALYPTGTKPEWAVYWALLQMGYRDGEDFFYLVVVPGVGHSYWSQVDFFFPDTKIVIEVQGIYWHYTLGSERQARDIFRQAAFAQRGIEIVFIDEDDALRDPLYYTREALRGRDHSKIRRG